MPETASLTFPSAPAPNEWPDALPPVRAEVDTSADTTSTISALDRIKERIASEKAKAAASLTFKLPVPRMPVVVVEFETVNQQVYMGLSETAIKTEMKAVDFNARILTRFCRGVYLDMGDDELIPANLDDPTAPAPRFDETLAKTLGEPFGGVAYEFVKWLYKTDGDLISTAAAVLDLSGFGRAAEIEATVRGN